MIAYTLSDSIVHVERCVIASSTPGDFDYCIATWLRVGAAYDLNFRLIKRYRNTFIKPSLSAEDVATRIAHVTPVTYVRNDEPLFRDSPALGIRKWSTGDILQN